MVGGAYVVIALCFGLGGGLVGRAKGSSFLLWFLLCVTVPPAIVAAVFLRDDRGEPERPCPGCGKRVKLHDALCTRCGTELEFPAAAPPGAPATGR